jgi:acyl carrier protein
MQRGVSSFAFQGTNAHIMVAAPATTVATAVAQRGRAALWTRDRLWQHPAQDVLIVGSQCVYSPPLRSSISIDISPDSPIVDFLPNSSSVLALASAAASSVLSGAVSDGICLQTIVFSGMNVTARKSGINVAAIRVDVRLADGALVVCDMSSVASTGGGAADSDSLLSCAVGRVLSTAVRQLASDCLIVVHPRTFVDEISSAAAAHLASGFATAVCPSEYLVPAPVLTTGAEGEEGCETLEGAGVLTAAKQLQLVPAQVRALAAHWSSTSSGSGRFEDVEARAPIVSVGTCNSEGEHGGYAMHADTGASLQRYAGMVWSIGHGSSSTRGVGAGVSAIHGTNASGDGREAAADERVAAAAPPLYTTTWEAAASPSSIFGIGGSGSYSPMKLRVGVHQVATMSSRLAGAHTAAAMSAAQAVIASGRLAPKAMRLTTAGAAATAPISGLAAGGGGSGAGGHADASAAWGVLKVMSSEARGVVCGGFDADASGSERASISSSTAIVSGAHAVRCGVLHQGTLVRQPQAQSAYQAGRHQRESQSPPLLPRRPVLITGGLGSIGQLMAGWIARTWAGGSDSASSPSFTCSTAMTPPLILLGRSGRASSVSSDALHGGALVTAARCDVAHTEDASFASACSVGGGCIGSVIHAGGVLHDATIPNQTAGKLSSVFAPKVAGLARLQTAVLDCSGTDACVLFSSIASLLGSAGQTNYVAANGWLDGWAVAARRQGAAGVVSVQWGAWTGLASGGMAANDAGTIRRMERLGVGVLSPEVGLDALSVVMQSASMPAVVVANPFDWTAFLVHVPSPPPQLFAAVADEVRTIEAVNPPRQQQQGSDMKHLTEEQRDIAALPRAERFASIQATVMNTVDRVLGHTIDPDKPLIDAGVDSLSMAELGQAIETDVGVTLPATVAFDYPTVAAIAGYVSDTIAPPVVEQPKLQSLSGGSDSGSGLENLAALVGMGLRFAGNEPGGSDSAGKFWRLISSGGDAITVVPTDRWDIDTNTSAMGLHRRRDPEAEQYSRHGSFIGDIDHFDCGFFSVTPAEAAMIDPQQRMILKVGVDAMHGGGLNAKVGGGVAFAPSRMTQRYKRTSAKTRLPYLMTSLNQSSILTCVDSHVFLIRWPRR